MNRVPDDPVQARRENRERVAAMRTGYTPVDPAWREALPTRWASTSGPMPRGRGYTPPRDRMLARLQDQRTRLVRDGDQDDPTVRSEIDLLDIEIRRLEASAGVT